MEPCITKRQLEVLNFIKKGYANKQIAKELGIGEPTVKMHITAMFQKYKVHNRLQLLIYAQNNNL